MDAKALAKYMRIPEADVVAYLKMEQGDFFKNDDYVALLRSLNRTLLTETLAEARAAYEAGLPRLRAKLSKRYNVNTSLMSPNSLGNWLVTALKDVKMAEHILEKHQAIPPEVIEYGLQDILDMVEYIPEGAREWQRAICVLSLPLMKQRMGV